MNEAKPAAVPRRIIPHWLSWWWGVPGNGIDFQPNVRLWGIGIRMAFVGIALVGRPAPEASPVVPIPR